MILYSNILDQKMMILDSKLVNNYAHVKFKRTLMYSGKESFKWLKTLMSGSGRESSTSFVMVAPNICKTKFTKPYQNSTMIRTRRSGEHATR